MKPLASPLVAALALAVALQVPSAPLRAQPAPPTAPASAGPAPWRPVIVIDPRDVLRSPRPHPTPKRRPAVKSHAAKRHLEPYRRRAMPTPEIFERHDTAPAPRPS